ncbi:MAG: hypothetical protein BECKG1743F_GA0114225_112551 [Candidatus Kentron sp. G]|nr:MAG: hypothetical protein BECKG1743F_GA0114225_112551 [Candidatus Kentron sp. G]
MRFALAGSPASYRASLNLVAVSRARTNNASCVADKANLVMDRAGLAGGLASSLLYPAWHAVRRRYPGACLVPAADNRCSTLLKSAESRATWKLL